MSLEQTVVGSCANCGIDIATGDHFYKQKDGQRFCAECDELANAPECEYCAFPVLDADMVRTKDGPMHESCAEGRYPIDHGDSVYPN